MKQLFARWRLFSESWPALTIYQRFESLIAFVLTLILVILVALYRLIVGVVGGLVFGALNPLEYKIFQTVFGENDGADRARVLQFVVSRQESIIQAKIVLLTALLALARKFGRASAESQTSSKFRTSPRKNVKGVADARIFCDWALFVSRSLSTKPAPGFEPGTY